MGDLRDALKKAGLIDDKTDKRLRHEQRVERKELGREGLEARQREQQADHARREEEKRAEARAAQQRLDQERARAERGKRLRAALAEQAVRGTSGPRRFHWVDAEGYCPWIAVDDATGRRLEAGELGLVALLEGSEIALVPRALAIELHQSHPRHLLFLAGGPG